MMDATRLPWTREGRELFCDWVTDRGIVTSALKAECDNEASAALIVEAVNNYDRLRAIEAAARAATERWLAEDAKGLDGAMADLTAELR